MNDEEKRRAREILMLLEELYSPVQQLPQIVRDFDENNIKYCVVGGIAVNIYNYSRYTDDIDLIVSKKSFNLIEKVLIGSGYTFRPGSKKNLYYHAGPKKIAIDILIEGDKEGSVLIPNPKLVRMKIGGIWYLSLEKLIEMKLNAGRTKDYDDVSRLIEYNNLTKKYVNKLSKSVRTKFLELLERT
jgi:predicted nucleotidyltransferase